MKPINGNIKIAISNLKLVCVSNEETGRRLGISGKHVAGILSGEVQAVRDSTWTEKIEPVLRPLLAGTHGRGLVKLNLPAKQRNRMEALAASSGQTIEDYITDLVLEEIQRADKYNPPQD